MPPLLNSELSSSKMYHMRYIKQAKNKKMTFTQKFLSIFLLGYRLRVQCTFTGMISIITNVISTFFCKPTSSQIIHLERDNSPLAFQIMSFAFIIISHLN